MKIAVYDDEENIRKQISDLVKRQVQDADIGLFKSGEEMLCARETFDIHFLDIEMGGVSGIELARRIRADEAKRGDGRSVIIFVTGFREYMEDAFDVNAFHYLVKPIREEKFTDVFLKATQEVNTATDRRKKSILIKDGDSRKKLFISEIQYVESRDRKAVFHTAGGIIETYAKMYDLENELGTSFFRCHRGYLVNLEKVTEYSSNSIQVLCGDSIMLAEKKYTDFVRAYIKYAKSGGVVNV